MAEPEDLILEGAHFATRVARDAWRRYGTSPGDRTIALTAVRARLEMFLTALVRTSITVVPMEPPPPASWLSRLARGPSPGRRDGSLHSGTDGRRVHLPATLPPAACGLDALTLYRLLAVEQAVRMVRGTARVSGLVESGDTRDWFLLAEAAAVDRWIAREVRGLVPAVIAVRAFALASRTGRRAPALDSTVAQQVHVFLAADPLTPPFTVDLDGSPEQSLAWARTQTARGDRGRYRGVSLPWYWGEILAAHRPLEPATPGESGEAGSSMPRPRVAEMRRRPRVREAGDDEDDSQAGTWIIRADEPQESVEDPFGLQRPADRDDDADPEGLADSLSDLPEARMVRTPGPAREVLRSGDAIERVPGPTPVAPARRGFVYPEWDHRLHAYRSQGAIVREPAAPLGEVAWIDATKARHARLARRVRARFERLRPRHVRLDRQADGSEPDIAAWVGAFADTRAGVPLDGRVYVERRPSRRELGVALLADVSASTDAWVSDTRRIVDVEKEALLVVCEALDALGDRYGIFAFSGESADDVAVLTLKAFDERRSLAVERRIAALDADRYTRVGAAIRHVTAALGRERATRRLLLILSDGKPNDVDVYEGLYGVEDTRQAVAEAHRQGVTTFCLTIDREAPRYARRIFGRTGFAVLRRTDELPAVMVEVLRRLVRC
jgi:nitric oxide reductase NorD protein